MSHILSGNSSTDIKEYMNDRIGEIIKYPNRKNETLINQ